MQNSSLRANFLIQHPRCQRGRRICEHPVNLMKRKTHEKVASHLCEGWMTCSGICLMPRILGDVQSRSIPNRRCDGRRPEKRPGRRPEKRPHCNAKQWKGAFAETRVNHLLSSNARELHVVSLAFRHLEVCMLYRKGSKRLGKQHDRQQAACVKAV